MNRAEDFERARAALDEDAGAQSFRSGHYPKAYWTDAKRRGYTEEKRRHKERTAE